MVALEATKILQPPDLALGPQIAFIHPAKVDVEVKVEVEEIRDSLKAEMMERETEELIVGSYIIRWTSILSNRFDTTGFKRLVNFPKSVSDCSFLRNIFKNSCMSASS